MPGYMNYQTVFDIIAMHAHDLIPWFADKWERWPDEDAAERLIDGLKKKAQAYPAGASKLISAANAIITGSKLSIPAIPDPSAPQGFQKLSSMLDAIADRLEKKGLTREAFEIDKVADEIEKLPTYQTSNRIENVPWSRWATKIKDLRKHHKIEYENSDETDVGGNPISGYIKVDGKYSGYWGPSWKDTFVDIDGVRYQMTK